MQIISQIPTIRTQINKIKDKDLDIKYKIKLIENFKDNLKYIHKDVKDKCYQEKSCQPKNQLCSTFISSSMSVGIKEQQEQLIDKILKKQKQKIQLDQEIQTCQDDLSQMTKVISTKQAYNDELGIQILMTKKQIQEEITKQQKIKKVKSSPNIFKIIFKN